MKRRSAAIVLLATFLAVTGGPAFAGAVYSIQVAASEDNAAAQEISEQMNRMGHASFVRLEEVPGKGQWYRVYVEKFESKAQADKEAATLKSLGLLNECYVRELKDVVQTKPPTNPRHISRNQTLSKAPPTPTTQQGAKKVEAVSSGTHFLHVASFKAKENAEKTVAHLEKKGQKAFFAEEGTGADRWFRTYIGEFADDQEARRAGALLKEKGLISYFKVISFKK